MAHIRRQLILIGELIWFFDLDIFETYFVECPLSSARTEAFSLSNKQSVSIVALKGQTSVGLC